MLDNGVIYVKGTSSDGFVYVYYGIYWIGDATRNSNGVGWTVLIQDTEYDATSLQAVPDVAQRVWDTITDKALNRY